MRCRFKRKFAIYGHLQSTRMHAYVVRKYYVYVLYMYRKFLFYSPRALLNQQKVEQSAKMAFPVEVGTQTKFQQCRVYL